MSRDTPVDRSWLMLVVAGLLLGILGCQSARLPKEKIAQYPFTGSSSYANGQLQVRISNPLKCPLRVWLQQEELQTQFDAINPVVLAPLQDSLLTFAIAAEPAAPVTFASRLGDTALQVRAHKIALPFPPGRQYSFIQGYHSTPTHNTDWSRYALDFGLKIGDTICAATDGVVVGMVDQYKRGGPGREWKDYGNFITIYDPQTALFTQYAHLRHLGSLVQIGDSVAVGQPIGLAGMTGQTNIEHVHVNCLQPVHSQAGLISIPMDSIGPYAIKDLQRYQAVGH